MEGLAVNRSQGGTGPYTHVLHADHARALRTGVVGLAANQRKTWVHAHKNPREGERDAQPNQGNPDTTAGRIYYTI